MVSVESVVNKQILTHERRKRNVIVTGLPEQPDVDNRTSFVNLCQNSKNDHWCTSRHMSTKTVPTVYQSSKTIKNSQKTVKTAKITVGVPIVTCLLRLRRIHKALRRASILLA